MWYRSAMPVLLTAVIGFSFLGCDSDSAEVVEANVTYTPFERVASFDGNWSDVATAADAIAASVSGGWALCGDEVFDLPYDTDGNLSNAPEMIKLVELCHTTYDQILLDEGGKYSPSLPWEVSVHSDGTSIYVDMLNPEAIIRLNFADVADQSTLLELASTIESELRAIVKTGVEGETDYVDLTTGLGHLYTAGKEADDFAASPLPVPDSPYTVVSYTKEGGTAFTAQDVETVAAGIQTTLVNNFENLPTTIEGLDPNSMWKGARTSEFAVGDVMIVEACEPIYAQMALMTGAQHATAMPCQMSVAIDKSDATGKTLLISIPNPEYLFPVYFIDGMMALLPNLPAEMQTMFMAFPAKVMSEMAILRDAAISGEIASNGVVLNVVQ